jgi:uncharacterized protein (TIGR04222 family)
MVVISVRAAPPPVRLIAVLIASLAVMLLALRPALAQQGWTIEQFHADIRIEPDTSLLITEAIDVNFGTLQRHGIFREIPVRYEYNAKYERIYRLNVEAVTDGQGKKWPYKVERNGANERIRIGDPNREVSGPQSYRITYRVRGALNGFDDHDELYWNVNGADWGVPSRSVSATALLGTDGFTRAACFQGRSGSTDPCRLSEAPNRIDYAATRPLSPGEQLTIVAAVRKGVLPTPEPILERKPRQLPEYFEPKAPTLGAALLLLLGGLAFVGRNWWVNGRDRRYTTLYYLTENPEEETRPLFKGDSVVVEFQPPEGLRPAQMGLLLDEQADTKDVTATIVDLAVRGYLTITEIPKTWLLGSRDWKLTRKRTDSAGLEPYEAIIFNRLFQDGAEVTLSDLKTKFHTSLREAQSALYKDAARRGWFSGNPETVRNVWRGAGIGVSAAGAGLTYLLGRFLGAGIAGLPVILVGLILLATAGWMPRRTAKGSELLRRILGFRRYIETAETDRQRFNEQANIFATYLPYAIVFGSVEKWARAFRDIDTTAATAGWYSGASGFHATDFSRNLESFSSNVSSTIASTPGGSGGSGFAGGSAGGGGGGGGGGSW